MWVSARNKRGLAYYCNEEAIRNELKTHDYDKALLKDVHAMLEFWKTEATFHKVKAAYPKQIAKPCRMMILHRNPVQHFLCTEWRVSVWIMKSFWIMA